MKLLSRSEELVLLAVMRLGPLAYSVQIRRELIALTGKKWSFGTIFDPLDRLEKNGQLESHLTEPTPERGGRSKRIYRVTADGKQALLEIKRVQDSSWASIKLADLRTGT